MTVGAPVRPAPHIERRAGLAAGAVAGQRRLVKLVDAAAIRHNLRTLRAASGGRRLMPVVKGDAYGLGAAAVGRVLVAAGADALAVDTVAEGIDLRESGFGGQILVMDVDVPDNAADCLAAGLVPSVTRVDQVRRYAELGRAAGAPVAVWLRVNVGFNRFGPRNDTELGTVLDALRAHRDQVRVATVFAHLSSSAWSVAETREQAAAFRRRLTRARQVLGGQVAGSLAATHGLLHQEALQDTAWVRPGIGLYGLLQPECQQLPGWAAAGLAELRPALTVQARVLDVVTITVREGLGYARSAAFEPGRRVASVAIGFSRGITSLARGLTVLVRGRRCRLVGLPGMDCAQFDVTEVPEASAGDWATVIGPAKGAIETCAEIGCTLYELLATIRAPVRLIDPTDDDPGGNSCMTA